jgi:hypothetical protein
LCVRGRSSLASGRRPCCCSPGCVRRRRRRSGTCFGRNCAVQWDDIDGARAFGSGRAGADDTTERAVARRGRTSLTCSACDAGARISVTEGVEQEEAGEHEGAQRKQEGQPGQSTAPPRLFLALDDHARRVVVIIRSDRAWLLLIVLEVVVVGIRRCRDGIGIIGYRSCWSG